MRYFRRVWKIRSGMTGALNQKVTRRPVMLAVLAFLLTCAGQVYGVTRGVVLTWDPPAAPEATIAEYHVFYGTQSGIYTNSLTAYDPALVIPGLAGDTTYYFAVMAIDTDGHSSSISDEASIFLEVPKPVELATEVYADDNGVPYAMTISGSNSTTTDWELDYSTNLVDWTYLTGDHGIDVYTVVYFGNADRMFYRLVDY